MGPSDEDGRVDVVGLGEAGLWCLFAAALEPPGGDVHVDLNGFNPDDDAQWVARHYVPSIRSLGDIATAAYLIEPGRLTIFNRQDAKGAKDRF
ncbi:MAG: hypothetical protein IID09_02090 [Candidatus Hydrogenedentes bacterium]|nr:hypothetical protein [Candidatus Hydrogenedentota bacterium]